MGAAEASRADWLDNSFWERLDLLETRHQNLQSEHEHARRKLENVRVEEAAELRAAWQRYCEVIAELDRAAADFEVLRTQAI